VPHESALGVSLLNRRAPAAWRRRHDADNCPHAALGAPGEESREKRCKFPLDDADGRREHGTHGRPGPPLVGAGRRPFWNECFDALRQTRGHPATAHCV